MKHIGALAALMGGLLSGAAFMAPAPAMAAGQQTLTMEATAYGPSAADNYPYGPTDYFGQPLTAGDVAVDPSVIPLRTCLYVTGYSSPNLPTGGFIGEADDEGGAIKGYHVDLYMNASPAQVSNFGIQHVKVTILGPAHSKTLSGTAACASYAGSIGQGGSGSGSTGGSTSGGSAGGTSQGGGTLGSGGGSSTGGHYLLVGLTPGEHARAVYTLQADLDLLRDKVPVASVYTAVTARAVSAFERSHGLKVGGPTTMAFRNAMLRALRTRRKG